jgi:hypothetical protein
MGKDLSIGPNIREWRQKRVCTCILTSNNKVRTSPFQQIDFGIVELVHRVHIKNKKQVQQGGAYWNFIKKEGEMTRIRPRVELWPAGCVPNHWDVALHIVT